MKQNYYISPRLTFALVALLLFGSCTCVIAKSDDTYPAGDVLAHIGKKAGVIVLCSGAVARERVPMPPPESKYTPENVLKHIQFVIKFLPPGAACAKLYLPAPPAGKEWTGDDVIAYALTQAKLYGPVGALREDDKVEILSQLLTADKAKDVISVLNLKPVYVVVSGRGTFNGTWSTTYGEMVLRQSGRRVVGTYTFGHGEIEGTVNGDTLKFKWIERDSGSSGTGEFTLSPDGDAFRGPWVYDSQPNDPPSEWTGQRMGRR